jgi:hypothetical protein
VCGTCNQIYRQAPASKTNGRGCPICKNKTERKLLQYLSLNFSVTYQAKYSWCVNSFTSRYLPFDFAIGNIIIELDGPQHFVQISNWQSPEIVRSRDYYKMQCAILNYRKIIRIMQEPIWGDTIDWQSKIQAAISILSESSSIYIIYIGSQYGDFPQENGIITI